VVGSGDGQRGRTAGGDGEPHLLHVPESESTGTCDRRSNSCQRESKLLQKWLSIRWVWGKGGGDALEAGNKSGRDSLTHK